jgi:hypothetical protein
MIPAGDIKFDKETFLHFAGLRECVAPDIYGHDLGKPFECWVKRNRSSGPIIKFTTKDFS